MFVKGTISIFALEKNKTMQQILYSRESVCAADDYVNCGQTIDMPDEALLEDLVAFIQHTHDGNYSFIPYTGGHAFWSLDSDAGTLAIVCDDGKQASYPSFDPHQPLKDIGITSIHAKHL